MIDVTNEPASFFDGISTEGKRLLAVSMSLIQLATISHEKVLPF